MEETPAFEIRWNESAAIAHRILIYASGRVDSRGLIPADASLINRIPLTLAAAKFEAGPSGPMAMLDRYFGKDRK